jgi:hypothetical protein
MTSASPGPRCCSAEQVARNGTPPGTFSDHHPFGVRPAPFRRTHCEGELMNGLIYLVGLVVVIMAVLSLFGLR